MRTHGIHLPRGRRGAPENSPYGFRELKLTYPRYLLRAFGLAVALHLSAIGIGSVALSLRGPSHPASGNGRGAPPDTVRIHFVNVPPPLVSNAIASDQPGPMIPPQVQAAMPLPVPDFQVSTPATIPTVSDWNGIYPWAAPGDRESGDSLGLTPGPSGEPPRPDDFILVEERPVLVSMPGVEYPAIAREAGVEGKVLVLALVGEDGTVRETRIAKRVNPLLDDAARQAVSKAIFKPAVQARRPVQVWASVPVVFRLN